MLRPFGISDDHLRHALSTKSFASYEILLLEACESIACTSKCQDNGGGDQAAGVNDETEPLNQ